MSDKTTTDLGLEDSASRGRARQAGVVPLHTEAGPVSGLRVKHSVRLGRDEAADLVIPDDKVSRFHAVLEPAEEGIVVSDRGSHNGTFVNGARIEGEALAPYGSVVRVGRTILLVTDDVAAHENPCVDPSDDFIGGPALAGIREQIAILGLRRDPVLVTGETGSGKERVARALHRASKRKGELVAVNCAAIPKELVESELFGYVAGAFSGARGARDGLFRTADGGTLFLDEVAELPLDAQAKLLRVLEESTVRPVGADRPAPVDVRVVCATHQRLEALSANGRFREDLFHRLAVFRIEVPPLRERPQDAVLLALHFLHDTDARLSVGAAEAIALGAWPGNVRQLRNVIQRALASAAGDGRTQITLGDLGELDPKPAASQREPRAPTIDDEVLRARIVTALQLRAGNVARVAKDLGLHRARLYEAFVRLGIDPEAFRTK